MLVTSNFLHFTIFLFLWFCIQCLIMLCAFRIIVCESCIILKYCHWNGFCGFCFFIFSDAMWALISNSIEFFFFKFFQLLFYSQRVINLSLSFSLSVSVSLVVPEFFSKFMSWSTPPSFHPTKKFCIFSPHKFEIFPVSFHPNTWDFRQVLFHFTTNLRFLSSFVSSGLKFIQ